MSRPTKYRFAELTKRGRRINVRTKKPARVRGAAYNWAARHGFHIRAIETPQGLSVTRIT